MQPEMVTREFKAIIAASGLPDMRLHDLRHSCATLLLAQGVHPKLVQETLGHSIYQLTMDTYSHMIPQLRNEVADRMDEILSPTNAPTKTTSGRLQ
jgi:integrase